MQDTADSATLVNVLNRRLDFPGTITGYRDLADGSLELTIQDENGTIETQILSFIEQVLLVERLVAGQIEG